MALMDLLGNWLQRKGIRVWKGWEGPRWAGWGQDGLGGAGAGARKGGLVYFQIKDSRTVMTNHFC